MGCLIKKDSAVRPLVFLMVDATDHVTGKTGLSPTVTISKNGGSFAAPSGSVSEIGSGWYKVAANATDSNTLGPLLLHATASGADPVDDRFDVVAVDPDTASVASNLSQILGASLTESDTGYLAAAFKKLFDVETPVLTAESVNQTADVGAGVTLAGGSAVIGSTAPTIEQLFGHNDIYVKAFKNGSPRLCARVFFNGVDVKQSDLSSIIYNIFLLDAADPDHRTVVEGHSDVLLSVSDVIFDELQNDAQAGQYNFRHQIPVSVHNAFAIAGGKYLVEYTLSPVAGERILVRFRVDVI